MNNLINLIGISEENLNFSFLIANFLFPFTFFSIALYFITEKIFNSKIINGVISVCISFITVILFNQGGIIGSLSVFIICMSKIRGTKGIFIGIIAAIAYGFIIGWLANVLSSLF